MSETTIKTRRIELPFESVDEKPYIFASYGHNDKEVVFPLLKKLYETGYNVWYDEGIDINKEYNEVIASHVKRCEVFVLFVSKHSVTRPYVTDNELGYANRLGKVILPLFIESDVELPAGVDMVLKGVRYNSIEEIIAELKMRGVKDFGERIAQPTERDIPLGWLDEEEDTSGEKKNLVSCIETPYAYVGIDSESRSAARTYISELFNAGYNVRTFEYSDEHQRTLALTSTYCAVFMPVLAKSYVESGAFEREAEFARNTGKHFVCLMVDERDEKGNRVHYRLSDKLSMLLEGKQMLNESERTAERFLTEIEKELEKKSCCIQDENGKVTRRSFEVPDFLYEFTENGEGIILTKYTGDKSDVVIKKGYGGFRTLKIGKDAFGGNSLINSVTIPHSVTSIDDYAFYGCSSLTGITIPHSVTNIGDRAFSDCSSLTRITIPDSITSIGYEAFGGCSSLTDITIPDSVTSIGALAFYGCSSLTSITIPDSLTSIGYRAFEDCGSLNSITISDSVTSIGGSAFSGCSSLAGITIPDSVTSIGGFAFSGCSSLTGISVNDDNINYCDIDGVLFSKDKTLLIACPGGRDGDYSVPDSVTSIGYRAFEDCGSLNSITISDSVTSIGGFAFSGCSSLAGITIPDSVTSIGGFAFSGCSSLTGITIPDSVTSIGAAAFSGCSSLTGITIPDSVTSIGTLAFKGCSSLTSITIPDSLTSIGNSAFKGCSSLTVRCSENSYAWRYCEENDIRHEPPVASEFTTHKESAPQGTEEVSAASAEVPAASEAPQEKALAPTPRKKSPARWFVPVLILLALAAAAGLQLSGLVDILGLLGL